MNITIKEFCEALIGAVLVFAIPIALYYLVML